MRFLVDQNRSPLLAEALRDAGHDVVHTNEIGLETASDPEIFALALDQRRIIISADTDFASLLADTGSTSPSVVLFRLRGFRRAHDQARLLLANLAEVGEDLELGAIVVINDDRLRVRRLPI